MDLKALTLSLSSLLAPCAALASGEALWVLGDTYPPFEYADAKGRPIGFAVDVAERLLHYLGKADSPIKLQPWSRVYQTLSTRPNTLVMVITRTPAREHLFHWFGPLDVSPSVLYRLRNRDDIRLASQADLSRYRVTLKRDSVEHEWFRQTKLPVKELLASTTDEQDFLKLMAGRADLTPQQAMNVRYYEQKLKLPPGSFIPTLVLIQEIPLYLAMSKNSDPALVEAVGKAFRRLVDSGELARLKAKHLAP